MGGGLMGKRIHVGDRVRLAPDAPMADKGLGTAGVIVLDGMVERWDTAHVSWDNGSASAEMHGHLVKAGGGATRGQ